MSGLPLRFRLAVLAALPLANIGLQIDDATRRQYNEILEREHKGGRISQQERALLMSVYPKLNPPRDSMGMIALTDLGKNSYKGEQGGLYPGGKNSPPPEHLKAGLEIAKRIVPVSAEGHPAAEWDHGGEEWERISVPATECPRISERVLAEGKATAGDKWYRQEYLCGIRGSGGGGVSAGGD